MSKYLGPLVVVMLVVACGGTTDTPGSSNGGTTAGGTNAGGSNNSGGSSASGSAGKATGGDIAVGGGGGGGGTLDLRCPAHRPSGVCAGADTGLNCQYDYFSQCLCYTTAPGTFSLCQKVDPTCTMSSAGGAAGAGGIAEAGGAAGMAGIGGIAAKIALPPRLACSCSAMSWVCN